MFPSHHRLPLPSPSPLERALTSLTPREMLPLPRAPINAPSSPPSLSHLVTAHSPHSPLPYTFTHTSTEGETYSPVDFSSSTSSEEEQQRSFSSPPLSPLITPPPSIEEQANQLDMSHYLSTLMIRESVTPPTITPQIIANYKAWYRQLSVEEKIQPLFQQHLDLFLRSHSITAETLFHYIYKNGLLNIYGQQLLEKANGVIFNRIGLELLKYWTDLSPYHTKCPPSALANFAVQHHVSLQTLETVCHKRGGLTLHGRQMLALSQGHLFNKMTPSLLSNYYLMISWPRRPTQRQAMKELFCETNNILICDLNQRSAHQANPFLSSLPTPGNSPVIRARSLPQSTSRYHPYGLHSQPSTSRVNATPHPSSPSSSLQTAALTGNQEKRRVGNLLSPSSSSHVSLSKKIQTAPQNPSQSSIKKK